MVHNDDQLPAIPPSQPSRKSNGELFTIRNPNGYLRVSLWNTGRMPAYARTDARVTFELWKSLEVYGEIIDIFNRNNFHPHDFCSGTTGYPGEYGVAQSLPRLPSSGSDEVPDDARQALEYDVEVAGITRYGTTRWLDAGRDGLEILADRLDRDAALRQRTLVDRRGDLAGAESRRRARESDRLRQRSGRPDALPVRRA